MKQVDLRIEKSEKPARKPMLPRPVITSADLPENIPGLAQLETGGSMSAENPGGGTPEAPILGLPTNAQSTSSLTPPVSTFVPQRKAGGLSIPVRLVKYVKPKMLIRDLKAVLSTKVDALSISEKKLKRELNEVQGRLEDLRNLMIQISAIDEGRRVIE